ncbi:hypothetical protein F2Q68_00006184 [Brassica cretica]|uniref:Uncharacterized protein n=1 Tax=Brassica cretica TaxID=69181 RepID=A0A8S9JIP5_BRACR|nr:hypothetical protein F2Q68_00006184 [Brassica cretica]
MLQNLRADDVEEPVAVSAVDDETVNSPPIKKLCVKIICYLVSLEGSRQGVKGPLTIAAEIFELTPSLVVVEVKKKGGDRAEYEEFCNNELKPMLQNLRADDVEEPVAVSAVDDETVNSPPVFFLPSDTE